jgi:lipopolysaccharide/colanic/teichoic acid biosynthesis glycosyltransferase
MYQFIFKRLFDIMVSSIVLLASLPFMLVLLPILAVSNKGKVFFTQLRPGFKARPFTLFKLKTMSDEKDQFGNLLPDEQRLHGVGAFIRKTSLDEIPQMINVLKGDMSLIGPRPLLMEYLSLYSKEQARRHEVKPGITGWAQVNGRNAISWDQKFKFDVWYVENISFSTDLKILVQTVFKVANADGISGGGTVTMTKFEGSK